MEVVIMNFKLVHIILVFVLVTAFASSSFANELSKETINKVLKEAYDKYKGDMGGKNADYIKALDIVDPTIFGITFVDTHGNIYEYGDTKQVVSIQSISKVFTAALVMS
ncbi:MAG: glutaminase, partial [Epsilonproteobacteria bacterium]